MRDESYATLFTNKHPTEKGYRKASQDDFSYYNSHCDRPVTLIRETLETWFERYPDDEKKNLATRFRNKRASQNHGAFWELYLHELFKSLAFEIQVHPKTPQQETRPDLLLSKGGVPYAFIEARLAGLSSDKVVTDARLQAELHDALNTVHSPNFFLMIQELRNGPSRISFKSLKRKLEQWLASLDPDTQTLKRIHGYNEEPEFQWFEGEWYLGLNVVARSLESRGKPDIRSIGSTGKKVMWTDSEGEIRTALMNKGSKYGQLHLPYLIAINYMGMHCDRVDWTNALYGSEAVQVYFRNDGSHFQVPFRKSNGFWFDGKAFQRQQVSAVLGGWHISPTTIAAHHVELYSHPTPESPVGAEIDLPRWFLPTGAGELQMQSGRSAPEILKLPSGWPGRWGPMKSTTE